MLLPDHDQVYAFTRRHGDVELLVLANWSGSAITIEVPDAARWTGAELLLSNIQAPGELGPKVTLQPWEARVYRRASMGQEATPHR
jgi:oligo-1,6-glucosidase